MKNFTKIFRFKIIFLIFTFFSSFSSLANQINSKEELIDILQNKGITPGVTIWLQHPVKMVDTYGKLPGLSKLTFIDANIYYNHRITKETKNGIVFSTKDSEGNNINIILSNNTYYSNNKEGKYIPSVDVAIATKDPSKKTRKWGKDVLMNISNQSVQIGMTEEQVFTSLGYPDKTNETSGPWGKHEQWIYGEFPNSLYLYIENGRLTSAQRSR